MNTEQLVKKLENWFDEIDRALIALSGGIDSSLVAYMARKMLGKGNMAAVISASASVKVRELNDARIFCNTYDIPLVETDAREIDDTNYRRNPLNRCFYCKSALYTTLKTLTTKQYKGYTILNGNNYSDFGDFRPGLEAAENFKVLSPLALCGFTKDDIRKVARHYQLPNWNKPASPCLSSRFPYGEAIDAGKLRMVEHAEDVLNNYGFDDVRVRYLNKTAKIEVPSVQIPELQRIIHEIKPLIKAFGFEACEIDTEGLVSGKLNRNINSLLKTDP